MGSDRSARGRPVRALGHGYPRPHGLGPACVPPDAPASDVVAYLGEQRETLGFAPGVLSALAMGMLVAPPVPLGLRIAHADGPNFTCERS